jgi:A/G-specific adenine glycosylase
LRNSETKIVQSLLAWFAGNARDLPWRRTQDPYAIWVSEIMLQQTQVKTVLPYWERWMHELPDVAALAGASTEKLHKLWEGLGYYTRVRNLQKAAQIVIEKHGGCFPDDYAQALDLPGIGPYTAGAICSIAFNQPKPILDGNVVRVLTRIFAIAEDARKADTRARLWRIADELVRCAAAQASGKRRHASDFNQALMELGALVCTPRQPRCASCPVSTHCVARREDRVQELPRLGPRVRATPRRFVAFVAERRNRFLVRQRPPGVVNAHLWEFPNLEVGPDHSDTVQAARRVQGSRLGVLAAPDRLKAGLHTDLSHDALRRAARRALGLTPKVLRPLCTIKHSITRYRITLEAFRVAGQFAVQRASAKGKWLTRRELQHLTFSSAHKRILSHALADHSHVRAP